MLSGPLTYGSKTLKAQGKHLVVRVNQKGTLQVERGGEPACGVWCAGCSRWQDFPGASLPGLMFPGRLMKSDALAGDRHPDNYKPLLLPSSLTMSSSLPCSHFSIKTLPYKQRSAHTFSPPQHTPVTCTYIAAAAPYGFPETSSPSGSTIQTPRRGQPFCRGLYFSLKGIMQCLVCFTWLLLLGVGAIHPHVQVTTDRSLLSHSLLYEYTTIDAFCC